MPTHIVVNKLGLTYKSTIGTSMATIPDVCKTPSPGGPVPIPYPNFAQQSSLTKGTTTVKAKHGKMIAIKGSRYGRSNGDEAGTAGGVKSSVNMKGTDWITFSFNVKMDGKNTCRHTDKKFHNNKNTVDLAGNIDAAPFPPDLKQKIKCAIHECDNKDYSKKINKNIPKDKRCSALGSHKHACFAEKMKDDDRVHSETFVDTHEDPPKVLIGSDNNPVKNIHHAFAKIKCHGGKGYEVGRLRRPDLMVKPGNICVDAKFACPDNVKSGKKWSGKMPGTSGNELAMKKDQEDAYQEIGGGKKPVDVGPNECSAEDCQ